MDVSIKRFRSSVFLSFVCALICTTFFVTYFASAQTACNLYTSNTAVPDGYAASYDVFEQSKPLLLKVFCGTGTVDFEVGRGASDQIVYENGYHYKNGSWQQITFSSSTRYTDASGNTYPWFRGSAKATISTSGLSGTQYLVGFVCTARDGIWKCGCRDSTCATPAWQLQVFEATIHEEPLFSFQISSGGNKSVAQGNTEVNNITATLTGGPASHVSFSVSGLPPATTAIFAPTACTPTCTTNIAMQTSHSTPPGAYMITVQGQAGSIVRATTFALTVTASVTGDTQKPSVPTGLTATPLSTTSIRLRWNRSTDNVGVVGYRIVRDGTLRATVTGDDYIDTGLQPDSLYSYQVRAYDAAGNESDLSGSVSASTFPEPITIYTVGERVRTTLALNVRSAAGTGSVLLGAQQNGARGTIVNGPQYVDGFWWWQVNYDNAPDGWSVEDGLSRLVANNPPVVNSVSYDKPDVDTATPGIQFYEGTTVTYSSSASDPDGDTLSWCWFYRVDGGTPISFKCGTGSIPNAVFTYPTGSAGKSYQWTIQVKDGTHTVEQFLTVHIIASITASTEKTIVVSKDSTLKKAHPNNNTGIIEHILAKRGGSLNRGIVGFDITQIPAGTQIESAKVVLTMMNVGNMSTDGRMFNLNRVREEWAEGNARFDRYLDNQPVVGDGPGLTWNCAIDTDISNGTLECADPWYGGRFDATPVDGFLITRDMDDGDLATWDVTADVREARANGKATVSWILKKAEEELSGGVFFYSREGAQYHGNPDLAPRMIVRFR